MKKKYTRVFGDVHGQTKDYAELILKDKVPYSVQIGDMGFHYKDLDVLDSRNHKFFGGNHDNYDLYDWNEYALGDHGPVSLGSLDFFFIRGGFSIDIKARIQRQIEYGVISWWEREELNKEECRLAYKDYIENRPSIVITHDCPLSVSKKIGNPRILKAFGFDPYTFTCPTQDLLEDCFNKWQPDVWIFGHYHMDLDFDVNGTRFICLDELSSIDYVDGDFTNHR